jgi:hypothetical protein
LEPSDESKPVVILIVEDEMIVRMSTTDILQDAGDLAGRRSTACSSGSGSRARTIGRFVCHPGGTKVVAAIERALSLDNGALDHEPLHRLSLAVVPLAGMPRNLFGCEGMNLGPPECSGV